jgi:formate hydrogenlyase subunit 6/NADH:ubiquinone oxidoreductase subunit I
MGQSAPAPEHAVCDVAGLDAIIRALGDDGFEVLGPRVRAGAIVYDVVNGVHELPRGIGDEQAPGKYRLRNRADEALFGWATAAQSWKREFLAPRSTLVRIRRNRTDLAFETPVPETRKRALLGARGCDLAGIDVQDRVLEGGPFHDPDYAARRRDLFVIAVHCGEPAGTCFCVSMGTGPAARGGFDLAMTEILEGQHRFLIEVGTQSGRAMLNRIPHRPADAHDHECARNVLERSVTRMGRALDTHDIRNLLYANQEHPRWDDVASRCLGCANCTNACPTCFCTTVEDTTDLEGDVAERTKTWDSCFTLGHSRLHEGTVRASLRSRYRQWLTHKVATWIDQFGTSGCVGCGRCITWCPVGIDITEEVAAIRGGHP